MTKKEIEALRFKGVLPEVDEIEGFLWRLAGEGNGNMTNYKPIGIRFNVPWEHNALGPTLGEISRRSYLKHGVLLSALVWSAEEGNPGGGFFDLALDFNFTVGRSAKAREAFWVAEVQRVFQVAARMKKKGRKARA